MAPNLNIMADPGTNRVIATGVQYDASGNMTNDGTQAYSYDEANRLLTSGVYSYTYSGLENKRLVVYGSITSPSATLNLYGPDGKRLGWYRFGTSNSWTTAIPQGFSNYLYLGNKPLNYAKDRIGSNRSDGTYYPYGNPYRNANFSLEDQAFGTHVQDSGSALLYADQRYYNPGFGRFMTPDRSDANIVIRNPTSWNRFAYTNGDPLNAADPSGKGVTFQATSSYCTITSKDNYGNSIAWNGSGWSYITIDNSVTVTAEPPTYAQTMVGAVASDLSSISAGGFVTVGPGGGTTVNGGFYLDLSYDSTSGWNKQVLIEGNAGILGVGGEGPSGGGSVFFNGPTVDALNTLGVGAWESDGTVGSYVGTSLIMAGLDINFNNPTTLQQAINQGQNATAGGGGGGGGVGGDCTDPSIACSQAHESSDE